jgi:hypothetical protein
MKKGLVIALAMLVIVGIASVAWAAPIVITHIHASGVLNTTFTNATYTATENVGSFDFSMTTTYGTTTVDRTFDIHNTMFYLSSGCAGTNPNPGNPDWGYFTTTAGTGEWTYNAVEFQKNYNQYPPSSVHTTSGVDFATGATNIYNYCAGTGYRKLWHEVGLTSTYKNYVWESVANANQIVKMETTATLGGDSYFTGHGTYSPPTANTFFTNSSPFSMTGDFNGVAITFTGGTYNATHSGTKGAGWHFNVDNP